MKIAIVYFSGTGNTEKVANKYREYFKERGHECDLFPLPISVEPDFSDYDMLGVGYPIHSFNAPQNVLKFAKGLKKRKKMMKAFIFKTSGEPVKMSRVSSLKLINLLKRRGYDVSNEYHYVMPYNMIFRHTDHEAYTMWQTARALVPVDCNDILNGTSRRERKIFLGGLWAWFCRIEQPGAHIIGHFYRAKEGCTGCGLCAKNCPVGNIKMVDGKPEFGNHCLICARCSFRCPKDCISMGLLNGWKVHGAYSFEDGDPNEKNGHEKYCKKAYDRYYEAARKRIDGFNQTNESGEN